MKDYDDIDSFGEGEFGEAWASLNDAFGGLGGLDALAGATKFVVPIFLGGGLAFGTAAALEYFIEEPATREKWLKYKWPIGIGIGLAGGVAMYKLMGPTEGIIAIASSIAVGLAGFGISKLEAPAATAGLRGSRAVGRYLPRSAPSALGKGNLGSYVATGPKTALGGASSGGAYGRYANAPWGSMVM